MWFCDNMVEFSQEEPVGLRYFGQLSIRRSQALPLAKNVIIGCRIFFILCFFFLLCDQWPFLIP